jgi:hypothetical protein
MKFEMAHWYRGVLHPWIKCMGWVGFGRWFLTRLRYCVGLGLGSCCVVWMFVKNVKCELGCVVEILLHVPGKIIPVWCVCDTYLYYL